MGTELENLSSDLDTISNLNLTSLTDRNLNFTDSLFIPSASHGLECNEDYIWTGVQRSILAWISTLVILVGTTGNTVAYFVLKQKSYKNNVMAGALRYLAIMDNIILWTIVSREFLKSVALHDLALDSANFCMIYQVYSLTMTSSANWHLVTITLTRLIHLSCPFKTQAICSKLNYYLLITVNNIAIFGVHGGILLRLWVKGYIKEDHKFYSCYTMFSKITAMGRYYNILHVTINLIIPGSLLIVFNMVIGRELKKMEEREKLLKARPRTYVLDSSASPGDMSRETSDSGNAARSTSVNATGKSSEYTLDRRTTSVDRNESGLRQDFSHTSCDVGLKYSQSGNARGVSYHELKFTSDWLLLEGEELRKQTRDYRLGHKKMVGQIRKSFRGNRTRSAPENFSLNAAAGSKPGSDDMSNDPRRHAAENQATGTRRTSFSTALTAAKHSKTSLAGVNLFPSTTGPWVQFRRVSKILRQPVCLEEPGTDCTSTSKKRDGQESPTEPTNAETFASAPLAPASKHQKDGRVQSLTRLLITASAVFLCLSSPYWTYHLYLEPWKYEDKPGCRQRWFVRNLLNLLRFSNHSVNFFFYCATGSRFRQEFQNWVSSIRKSLSTKPSDHF